MAKHRAGSGSAASATQAGQVTDYSLTISSRERLSRQKRERPFFHQLSAKTCYSRYCAGTRIIASHRFNGE